MFQKVSSSDLKRIRVKYSRMTDSELLQVNVNSIIPEAREILTLELNHRGWDDSRIDVGRQEQRRIKTGQRIVTENPSSFDRFLGYLFIFGAVATVWIYSYQDDRSLLGMIAVAAIAVVLGGIGKTSLNRYKRAVQISDEFNAATILDNLKAGKPVEPYVLYVRPFLVTNKLPMENPDRSRVPYLSPSYFSEDELVDFEPIISKAVRKRAHFIGLGAPGEKIGGAARIKSSEEDWKENFEILSKSAQRLFVLPSHTGGTIWEISWLRDNNLLSKCIFIMPPRPKSPIGEDPAMIWARAASVLAEHGMELPAYDSGGLIFLLDGGGKPSRCLHLVEGSSRKLAKKLTDALSHYVDVS